MFKVSFKKDCKKVQTFNDRATIVTIVGYMDYPNEIWDCTPTSVTEWLWSHPRVDVKVCGGSTFRLEFSGKSVCSAEDTFDPVIGERIAESRAKIRLYKFVHTLLHKLYVYYFDIIFGDRYALCDIGELADYNKPGGILEEMDKYKSLLDKETLHLEKLLKKI
jgi:hypothetical protein